MKRAIVLLVLLLFAHGALGRSRLVRPPCEWTVTGRYSIWMLFSDGSEIAWGGENLTDCYGRQKRDVLWAAPYCPAGAEQCMALDLWNSGWHP